MTTFAIGRVRPILKGDWVATETYEAMSLVRYEGAVYQAVMDVPANAVPSTPNSTYWYLIGQRGADGAPGPAGPAGPPGPIGSDIIPVGFEAFWNAVTPPAGWLDQSRDLGEIPRALYPELWEHALASGNLLDDATWLARKTTNGTVGQFSSGNGVSTFRIPLLRRVYIRATDTGLTVGEYQKDAQQNITGQVGVFRNQVLQEVGKDAFVTDYTNNGIYAADVNAGINLTQHTVRLDASGQIRTADEVRPVTVVRVPIIKAFSAVVNKSTVEVSELVTQVGSIATEVGSIATEVSSVDTRVRALEVKVAGTPIPAGIPTGGIIMWSGSVASIPTDWALCNGANGTPNLVNRFIIAAGSSYAPGATGGATSATPTITVGATTLTAATIPSHSHTFGLTSSFSTARGSVAQQGDSNYSITSVSTGAVGSSGSHNHTGAASAIATVPPYYALAYIMKL